MVIQYICTVVHTEYLEIGNMRNGSVVGQMRCSTVLLKRRVGGGTITYIDIRIYNMYKVCLHIGSMAAAQKYYFQQGCRN
jgi:hypothetical protein